eukprot:7831514-Pyramimonas_sp.AAC.1
MLGRAGEVRIKSGSFDFSIMSARRIHWAPSGHEQAAQVQAAKTVLPGFRDRVSQARARSALICALISLRS